jgi:hypothetical protein
MPRPTDDTVRSYAADRSPGLLRAAYLACGDWERAGALVRAALVRGYGRRGPDGVVKRLAGDFPEQAGGPLGSLPPRQRAVLALRQGLGLTVEQAAAALGTSDGAVRQLGSRAASTLPADTRAAVEAVAADEPPVTVDAEAVARDWKARTRRRRALLGAVALVAAGSATAGVVGAAGGSGGGHAAASPRGAASPPATPSAVSTSAVRYPLRTTFLTTASATALQNEVSGLLRAATGREPASLTADQLANAAGALTALPVLEADAGYLLGADGTTEKVSITVARPSAADDDQPYARAPDCGVAGACATYKRLMDGTEALSG